MERGVGGTAAVGGGPAAAGTPAARLARASRFSVAKMDLVSLAAIGAPVGKDSTVGMEVPRPVAGSTLKPMTLAPPLVTRSPVLSTLKLPARV